MSPRLRLQHSNGLAPERWTGGAWKERKALKGERNALLNTPADAGVDTLRKLW
jgi:hypothetical protein